MTNNIESRFYKNTKNTKNTNLDSKKSQEKKYQNQNTKKDSKNFTESKNIKAPLKRKSKKIKNYHFIQGDINDSKLLQKIFETYKIDSVIHFAAESHVDNSINSPDIFIKTNINGTFCLLNAAFNAWFDAPFSPKKGFENALFYHISTDEVFGSLGEKGYFSESSPYQPNSPYSASKASSDMLVRSFAHTYGLNAVISNCSNNYGRFQHDEKLIPTIIRKALSGEKIPIYGDGKNVRDWLYVDDHCDAILQIFSHAIENIGRIPRSLAEGGGSKTQKITPDSQKNTDSIESKNFFDTFCIGGGSEMENLTIANIICEMLDSKLPKEKSYKEQISFVKDRFGHDRRYAIDSSKLRKILGWSPKHTFNQAIEKTLDFYIKKYK
ncbi:NAD-dependent epimerase/dehydratase family protein [Helicobacter saguini]|uniref:NAD-dependent epimerase/dehydratase family protein n=1 Tax=Helicobacter saguini TaxID=1548018 RepID=A0A347W7G5_9HELI|nr:GDP-mannose 4,6-dehydratase [Helicobacter saguini]MWV61213.1 NAD-dependent epimerase/dehydratase family protein [Helicobacter saguini]MWV68120.1 NAD-dependent epimerase/dehydratase family protein [Helicobacter saguini]MWV70416.1 NAD-dependent epimerase/dehydratase family protein [Helicobacter saguini]MWV72317.1 NAD-dependent epimerase/dehydratase family protein [Helicobacter saguini]TLD93013.1 NAD-dependent epimerase/dehydratase family protein [Helicobacter saguini]